MPNEPRAGSQSSEHRSTKVVMIPSVGGGIGHISRTAALARALVRLDRLVEVEYLFDEARLRPFNIDACRQMGFLPRFLPILTRENRDPAVRACLDHADVIVDDCTRYLLPLRRAVPRAAWVSIPMHPVRDELFMDWPFMAQMDLILWAYAPLVGLPPELEPFSDKVVRTGPFLETAEVPAKAQARTGLGWSADGEFIVYAPRGFPFGREFGHQVLAGIYAGVEALRQTTNPGLQLILLAVNDPADLKGIQGMPNDLPDWVQVKGVLTQAEALLHARAADIVVAEGTSTMHEAAALRTPLVLVPGPIQETLVLANGMAERKAAQMLTLKQATPEGFTKAFRTALSDPVAREAMLDRAFGLVTGGGGAAAAARALLDHVRQRVPS